MLLGRSSKAVFVDRLAILTIEHSFVCPAPLTV
jgi:hypothetical protein